MRKLNPPMTWLIVCVVCIVCVIAVSWFAVSALRKNAYPMPTALSDAPNQSLAEVLNELDLRIAAHAPETHAALRPGLSRDEILRLEREFDLGLTDEIRQLYEWHDGLAEDSEATFFGIHQFIPLEQLGRSRRAMLQEMSNATGLQRGAYWLFAGHRRDWIELFPDGAGDGYFVDPTRQPNQGAVFYNFNEMGLYRFYPSLCSLLAAISACYDAGIYTAGKDASSLTSIELEDAIHQQFGR